MSRNEPKLPAISQDADVTRSVPLGLRVSAALAWRFLVVVAALYVIGRMLGYLSMVAIPLAIALLLAALLAPAVHRLTGRRVPRGLATSLVLVGGLGVVGGLLTFVIIQFTNGLPALQQQLNESLSQIEDWLIYGPLHLRQTQIQDFINQAIGLIQENQASITSSALTTAGTVGEILTGFLLTLFILIFFLVGGEQIWTFLMRGVPGAVRSRVDTAGRRGFASLVSYVRATAAVAVVDAVGIGVGLWIVGVPLVIPLATLVFLGAFVPIIGAVVAGAVAVLVALVTNGFVTALVVLAIVVGVMQLESHVLQPLLLGRAVKLHPLAVILAITVGLVAAGIPGALLAVPLLAVLNAGIKSLVHERDPDPKAVDVLAEESADPTVPEEPESEDPAPDKA
ncbi:putative PurR-regulated permease PerM [Prauserella shujinwangii]|uniref:Putative PurR-regulated permease PerM n=1 Tax=Prauserella shujinwangii TaxID=1453103 RepID=A0A2T0LV29_9PSEU|nr:AI-2E family transporter [Prauserella shujinwangii]PRX47684.1 putative PurR-regulated permease PerM [Prauserella shujinwangii]